jgi:hypothetical protein
VAGTVTDITVAEPAFVVERFEPAGARLEVAGHWLGLRGRRLIRPVLWLHQGESRRRLVAVLDHKPWMSEDGDPWIAAFEWEGGKIEAERAELEVGRDWVIALPVPGAPPDAGPEPRTAQPRRLSELERVREQLAQAVRERDALQDALARAREDGEQARADGERLVNDEYHQRERALQVAADTARHAREVEAARDLAERQLAAARERHAGLEERLAAAEASQADLASAGAERDKLRAQLKNAAVERKHLRGDLERAGRELASAIAEQERMSAALDAAYAERDRIRADRERLAAELAAARAEAERTAGEPPTPDPADRERAEVELTAARADRDRLEAELAAARADRERLEREAVWRPAGEPATRLAPPQAGPALWGARLVAFALVAILLIAVGVLVGGVL